ncbi:hypothetical protein [Achromobacter sp. UMC71]|uniref:hypothetical protein n=1 Tax=Achromobacter sp. UMC71 TaxID=1862320 RepID=UPI0016038873|nr:hypothetical protein [Achromobacter sp. UMC71]MBB1628373.1 hypothetical protein [Achromobacter sp. UMC71]
MPSDQAVPNPSRPPAITSPARRALTLSLAALACAPLRVAAAAGATPSQDRDALIRRVFKADLAGIRYNADHASLMRHLGVIWIPVESGAPGIEFENPLGGKDTIGAAMALLGTHDRSRAAQRLAEVSRLVPSYVREIGRLAPGRYVVPAARREAFDFPDSGVDAQGNFQLRGEHLALLRAANWRDAGTDALEAVLREGDAYWPMPYIDGKRPYGDSSFYQIDMARLLGEPYALDARGRAITEPAKDARLASLHWQTAAALQVFLAHASA